MQYGSSEIREYISAGLLANGRGIGDAIDGHRTLARLKVAAALAILDHRTVVSEGDWNLSEVILAKSDATRTSVLEYDRQAARAKVRDRAIGRAVFDEIVDDRHTITVRNRIVKLLTGGPMSRSDLRRAMGKQHYRESFDAILPHLEKISQVVVIAGDKAPHYALNPEFTGEPQFTPTNASSVGVNPQFTGEPDATVTDLDSRRSVHMEAPRPTRPAIAFMKDYIAAHADAAGWVPVSQIRAAGAAEGYQWDALHRARKASTNPRIVTSNTGPNSSWRIANDAEAHREQGQETSA